MVLPERNFNLTQSMVQDLGRRIIGGEFTNDGLPTEAELCEQFGISRSAVRESVKMLTAKGLIASKPRQGIRVLPEDQWNIFDPDLLRWILESKPTLNVLKEFLQLRLAIEPQAAALAARHADPQKIAAIEKALDMMRQAPDDSREGLEADIAFHISILYASNNRFYIRLRDFISTALRVSIRHTNPLKNNPEGIVEDHTRVFTAIQQGNPEHAKHVMFLLIDEALHFIEDAIAKDR